MAFRLLTYIEDSHNQSNRNADILFRVSPVYELMMTEVVSESHC